MVHSWRLPGAWSPPVRGYPPATVLGRGQATNIGSVANIRSTWLAPVQSVLETHSHVGEQEHWPPNSDFEQQLAHSLAGLSRSMQFWDQRQSLSGNSRSRSTPDSSQQELAVPQQQTEEQQAEDQLAEEQQSPLAGDKDSGEIEGSGEHNQAGLRGSAYGLDASFADPSGVRGGGGVAEDASALVNQADQPPGRASGFYSTHSGLFSYGGAEQSRSGFSSLSRRLEAAAEGNSYQATAGYNLSLSNPAPGIFAGSHRFSPYYFHQRQNQQAFTPSAYRFDAACATAAGDQKPQSTTGTFGDSAYGTTSGALSLQQQHQQQQQFLSGADQVGSTEMPDVVDPSSWRIQGTGGAGGHPESTSPTSTSSGEKSERRKRKAEGEETSAKPYACRFCSQSFDKSQALGGHMNRHRQEREREQLDNAQKLVLKQQGLQGLSGLPLQNLNPRAKVQGASQFSVDQVTLSRYNQAVQYQPSRSFLTGAVQGSVNPYSTLNTSALLNTASAWNSLGSYIGGGTASIASVGSLSHLETSGSSNLARLVSSGATPEDIFAASVLQTAAPASPQHGRTTDTIETQGDQDIMYGYPGVSTLTSNEASTSGPETSQFNFHNGRQSYEVVPQASPLGVGNMQLYSGVQHGSQLPQLDIPHNLDAEED